MSSRFSKENRQTDMSSVESQHNDLTAEENTEESYGSDLISESLGSSTPWRIGYRPSDKLNIVPDVQDEP
ncbi:hypothetical protein [Paenibacillus nasutitermitis]|uniref:Uncharacterized protein n=1 Tax=Paenibacillus nasutitermitis TaxID=1652958 RepID=A0A916YLB9_9BACL|nr:hypothetical protein [Paenibacillus nasutitermitis]GGD49352.1 hypothetical protein GCM10010911_03590 [Paenibacillus nasutitermitis]